MVKTEKLTSEEIVVLIHFVSKYSEIINDKKLEKLEFKKFKTEMTFEFEVDDDDENKIKINFNPKISFEESMSLCVILMMMLKKILGGK